MRLFLDKFIQNDGYGKNKDKRKRIHNKDMHSIDILIQVNRYTYIIHFSAVSSMMVGYKWIDTD